MRGWRSVGRLPSTDQRTTKRRPAAVVSSERCHEERPDLIILAVTSQVCAKPAVGEAAIAKWKEAGLVKPSILKPLLATIEKGLVRRRLGRLDDDDRRALGAVLVDTLGQ